MKLKRDEIQLSGNMLDDIETLYLHSMAVQDNVYWWDLPEKVRDYCFSIKLQISKIPKTEKEWLLVAEFVADCGYEIHEILYPWDLMRTPETVAILLTTINPRDFDYAKWLYRVHLTKKGQKKALDLIRENMKSRLDSA